MTASPIQWAWYRAPALVVKPNSVPNRTGQHHSPTKVGAEKASMAHEDAHEPLREPTGRQQLAASACGGGASPLSSSIRSANR